MGAAFTRKMRREASWTIWSTEEAAMPSSGLYGMPMRRVFRRCRPSRSARWPSSRVQLWDPFWTWWFGGAASGFWQSHGPGSEDIYSMHIIYPEDDTGEYFGFYFAKEAEGASCSVRLRPRQWCSHHMDHGLFAGRQLGLGWDAHRSLLEHGILAKQTLKARRQRDRLAAFLKFETKFLAFKSF